MAAEVKTLAADGKGNFTLAGLSRGDVERLDIADIDLVITTKTGDHIVLAGAGLAAMSDTPPQVVFSDGTTSTDQLLAEVGVVNSVDLAIQIPSSLEVKPEDQKTDEKDKEKDEDAQQQSQQSHNLTTNTEASIEKLVQQAKIIEENLHKNDYEYVAPHQYQPPSAPFSAAPGVPPPLSLTPVVALSIGNVVGTTTSGADIYGGGGADGSSASDGIGPRDALQFSAATITGTAGADVIYANGPLVGNDTPAVDRSNNAKEFLLTVAGYFTTLDDIQFSGVPAEVTIEGATDNGGGSWTLPSSYVLTNQSFRMIYDMDAARVLADPVFDLEVTVSGLSTKGVSFSTTQSFRFEYIEVTSVDQVTDPTLVYASGGLSKQIYVLPTLAQPADINSGDGDDEVHGGLNNDTIVTGSGNSHIYTDDGDDHVTTGNGNNTISLGSGNDIVTTGSGNDTITADDGDNTIDAGDGNNNLTLGDGDNDVTTGSGTDVIDVGGGSNTISSGGGNDTITTGDGNNTIDAGEGDNAVTVGHGNNVISAGSGNDTLISGDGDNIFKAGLGTNTITGGNGSNTADYSDITTTAISVTLMAAGPSTVTGTGLTDTLTNVQNITGSTLNDTIIGSTLANILSGGDGDDAITGGGGNDTYYGGEGNDTITGGTGADIIYAGNGDNTVYTGTAGADYLYGGTGDNTFVSQHAGVHYDGTNGAALQAGQTNTIDYSGGTTSMTIDLSSGTGIGDLAQGDVYAQTSVSGYNSINGIIGGSAGDTITGSNSDDVLDGGGGNDVLEGGLGNNTLIGGTGTNYYNMGLGHDTIIGSVGNWDEVRYQWTSNSVGIVVNLDSVAHSFTNSLGNTVTIAAFSGGSMEETANDQNAYSLGDYYTPVSGNDTSIDQIYGSYNGTNIIYSGQTALRYYGFSAVDKFYGGSSDDLYGYSYGKDRADGGSGSDIFYTWAWGRSVNMTAFLDGTLDYNGNSVADYLDKSVPSLTVDGVTYTGFAFGYNNETSYNVNSTTFLKDFENLLGNVGNDTLVGDNNANLINGRAGSNALYGMGGNDTIYAAEGSNTIDGGSGTDTVDFSTASWFKTGTLNTPAYVFLADATFTGGSDKTFYLGASFTSYSSRTGSSGTYLYSTITGVENINGSDYNDILYGTSSANTINGNNGDDIIAGNGGADTLNGNAGNDTFLVTAAQLPTVSIFNGSTGTDTVKASGYALSSGGISNAKFSSIEVFDIRNSTAGNSYSMNANDITGLADNGTSSSVKLKLDTGDTFTAVVGAGTGAAGYVVQSSNASDTIYWFYSDGSGHAIGDTTNRVAILDVYTGTG